MNARVRKNQLAIAVAAAIGTGAALTSPTIATAAKTPGKYVAGDVHNHTTCSDGSISMQKLIKKATDRTDTPWGLDWFVQAGHGGGGSSNCTLIEDATLETPAYPFIAGKSPSTSWQTSIGGVNLKGDGGGTAASTNMWRWQSVEEFQYPVVEYFNALLNKPLFIGIETNNPGHEHTSMSVITGQVPASIDTTPLPTGPGYTALGTATALSQWEYCFDRSDTDRSRGNVTGTATGHNWQCQVAGGLNESDPIWNNAAQKLIQGSGDVGVQGHRKSLDSLRWMNQFAPDGSYYLPTHLERAGPFIANGNNGFNVESLRDFNNVAPRVAFGMETQPGHGASSNRGEYQVKRNNISGVQTDSVGGTTYGGTGVYGGLIGGVWDALLGEGRNFWFFASSDWHNRGSFGPDDRRSSQDFYPGEYQRSYTMVRNGSDPKLRPQMIVDGMRSGNVWATQGQLIDRFAMVACVSYPGFQARTDAQVEQLAYNAAINDTDTDVAGCATMGEKLKVRAGGDIVVSIVVRDPQSTNYSPYTFSNPSLAQVGIDVPINAPVLHHVDLIRGLVTGYKQPNDPDYAGEWPRNTAWLHDDGTTADLSAVPAAAKNTSTAVIRTFAATGTPWTPAVSPVDGSTFYRMTYRIPAVAASQYVRVRGTNMPPSVPWETDGNGNPLADVYTNKNDSKMLRIPCATPHSAGNQFDGCPDHMTNATAPSPIANQKAVMLDVAAWSDLWFYSNPIYVEVAGSTPVQGVQ